MSASADAIATVGGIAFTMMSSLQAWIIIKLFQHDTALALLLQQVNPPGQKSLRDLVDDVRLAQASQSAKDGASNTP